MNTRKSYTPFIFLAFAIFCTGCSNTEDELLEVINLDEKSVNLCVSPQKLGVDFFQASDGKRYFAAAGDFSFSPEYGGFNSLPALQSEGYASKEATSLQSSWANYKNAYPASDKINAFIGQFDNICIGKMRATEIIDHTEPGESGPQVLQARFKYRVEFNDLVDDLRIEDQLRNGPVASQWPGTGSSIFTKTNKGWRLEMLHWSDF